MTLSVRYVTTSLVLTALGTLLFATQALAFVESDFYGTWTLQSETASSPAGELTGGITNKIVQLNEDNTSIDDYSQLDGYDQTNEARGTDVSSTCETAGRFTSKWELTGPSTLYLDPANRVTEEEVFVKCSVTGSASTTGAPRALSAAPTGEWQIKFADNGNTMIATTEFGPTTVTHVYTKGGEVGDNNVSGNDSGGDGEPTDDKKVPSQRTLTDDEKKLQAESDDAWGGAEFDEPISYSATTDETVPLTQVQRDTLKEQLTADITSTSDLSFAGDGWESDVTSGDLETPSVTRVVETGFKPQNEPADVTLSGQLDLTHPGLPGELTGVDHNVIVTLFSSPVVRIAQADTNGRWTLTVPADLFEEGEHVAFAAAEVNGVRSDQIEITKFIIEEKQTLSATTWLVIVNGAVAAIVVIVLIVVQVQRKKKFAA